MILFIYNNGVKLSDLESRLREFVPCDQVFPFPFVYIFLYLHKSLQFHANFIHDTYVMFTSHDTQ